MRRRDQEADRREVPRRIVVDLGDAGADGEVSGLANHERVAVADGSNVQERQHRLPKRRRHLIPRLVRVIKHMKGIVKRGPKENFLRRGSNRKPDRLI